MATVTIPSGRNDGRRVLFIHDSTLETRPPYREDKTYQSHHPVELYLMDADGRNAHLLRRIEPVIFSAAWSPDGKTLAITCIPEAWAGRTQPDGQPMRGGLFLLPANGKGEPRLLFLNGFTPAWSPDGNKIAFSLEQPRGQWSLHVANRDGSHETQLTDWRFNDGSPAWSPDGKRIAFDRTDNSGIERIVVMDSDGSHPRDLTTGFGWSCSHPTWSHDGQHVAFGCRSTDRCGRISDIGTQEPPCDRRIFLVAPNDAKPQPVPLNDHDGTNPEFARTR